MGKKSVCSFLGLLRFKTKKKARSEEEDYYRREDDGLVKKAYYKVWPSDEDRVGWVADPEIDAKATAFLHYKRQQFRCVPPDRTNADVRE
ncbi:hypothetical protein DM860_007496 [Cuscuta australis]|uniref:Uncharacterized protein n=1 Tax=Cuscuta australis TaxID=267555 RepID=A0A328E7V2_9ASTE|nr:hypothetical protein DM860_007496 [Cuscuta australis]